MQDKSLELQAKTILKWLGAGSIDIFGLPFAGKDAHGIELARLFDGYLIGGGKILRSSTIPKRIHKLMSNGELLPTKEYLEIVLPHLSLAEFEGHPLILSAVGRWHGEEAGVLEATAQSGHPLRAVIYLKVSEDEIWRRWSSANAAIDRGPRLDDKAEAMNTRFHEFDTKTIPVIEFYRDEGLLIEVNGESAQLIVLKEIVNQLYKTAKAELSLMSH